MDDISANKKTGRPPVPFWDRVQKTDTCWEWTGALNHKGYGEFHYQGKVQRAHHVSWTFANGLIPQGMIICHYCDNPSCVRPDHLFLGTHSTNAIDRERKGRGGSAKGDDHWTRKRPESVVRGSAHPVARNPALVCGERNPAAKVTWGIVREIRHWYAEKKVSLTTIAQRYGIGASSVHRIVSNRTWKEEFNA